MEDQGQPTPETEPKDAPDEEPKEPEAKYTDKDVDRLKGSARREGKQTAINELLGELEVESVEDIKALVEAYKTIEEETQTEADRAKKDAETFKAERDKLKEERDEALKLADQRLIQSELKASLIGEGARKDRLAKLLKEADLSEVEVGEDGVKNLEPVIKALKEDIPEWFGEDDKPSGSRPSPKPADNVTQHQQDKELVTAERGRVASAL